MSGRARGGNRIKVRVLALVGVGMLGPLAVLSFARFSGQQEMERQALVERTLLSRLIAERAEVVLTTELRELEQVSALIRAARGEATQAQERAALREGFLRHHGLFDAVHLLAPDGRELLAEPASASAVDGPALVAAARRAGRSTFTGLDLGRRRVYALVPVSAFEGGLLGVLAGAIDVTGAHLTALFKGVRTGTGEAIELIDEAGTVLASTDASRLLRPSGQAGLLAGLIDQHRTPGSAWPGAQVDGELVAFSPLPLARWGVSVRQPSEHALAFTAGLSREVFFWGLVVYGVALLFAWGAALSVTRPVATLTAEAERLTRGELSQPLPALPGDEVGRLGEALERMRISLQESLQRVAQANEVLEVRVAERTEALEGQGRALQAREETVRQLLGKVITAQEDERRRVARDLHDETSSSLAALTMRVQAAVAEAPPGALRSRLEEAQTLAVRMLDEVHRLIRALRPSVLDDLGLRSAILWYAERHLQALGIAVRCEFNGLDRRLPPMLETVVFRVVQEAMTNIAKHAKAETVLIQGAVKEQELTVEVEDDGEGFDPAALATPGREGRGWGLLGMRERVEMLGGHLTLDSAAGRGTHVKVVVPLPEEAVHG